MEAASRKADGRRIFTAEFKREPLARIERGEVSAAKLRSEAVDESLTPAAVEAACAARDGLNGAQRPCCESCCE